MDASRCYNRVTRYCRFPLIFSLAVSPLRINSAFLPALSTRRLHRNYRCPLERRQIMRVTPNSRFESCSIEEALQSISPGNGLSTRRSVLAKSKASLVSSVLLSFAILCSTTATETTNAAVGTLSEFADTNAVLEGITINVADPSQQESMISFLQDGFSFKILRSRQVGSVTDTWLGFGPQQLSIPSNFELPVSSFAVYGGHASIHIRYDAKTNVPFYKKGDSIPDVGNIAYLQVAVPAYRISQMTKTGATILDAYGIVNVISPSGLPIRGIVGISPDPIMFLAINCQDVKVSQSFYEQLGFVLQEYPYSRPSNGTGVFEPPQPKNSIYLSPSKNGMGLLLLQTEKKKKSIIKASPVFRSLNIVYSPSDESSVESNREISIEDPTGVTIKFVPVDAFEREESLTRREVLY